jgi:hypothetical protein
MKKIVNSHLIIAIVCVYFSGVWSWSTDGATLEAKPIFKALAVMVSSNEFSAAGNSSGITVSTTANTANIGRSATIKVSSAQAALTALQDGLK